MDSKNNNYIKYKWKGIYIIALSLLCSGTVLGRRAGAQLDARNIAQRGAQAALNAGGHEEALASLAHTQAALQSHQDARSSKSEGEIRGNLNDIHKKVPLNPDRNVASATSSETQQALQVILEHINARQYTEALSLHSTTNAILHERVVTDLSAHLHRLANQGTVTDELIEQLVASFRKHAGSESTGWQIHHASKVSRTPEGFLDYNEFYFDYLTGPELAELYVMVQAVSNAKKHMLAPFVFDIQDKIIRMSYNDEAMRQMFLHKINDSTEHNRNLKRILKGLKNGKLDVYPLIDETGANFKTCDTSKFEFGKKPANKTYQPGSKAFILEAAYESPNLRLGGLGAFMTDFMSAFGKNNKYDLRIISQFCDFMKRDYPYADFRGFVDHYVYGKTMRSSIYAITSANGVVQYLIKTDPRMERLFDIGKQQNVYKSFKHSEYNPKMIYFNTALATFAATLCGPDGNDSVDILHLHSWHTALAAALLNEKLNPIRERSSLKRVKILNTVHMHGPEQGFINAKIFEDAGLNMPHNRQKYSYFKCNNPYDNISFGYDGNSFGYDSAFSSYHETEPDFAGCGYDECEVDYNDTATGKEIELVNLLIETANNVDFINTVSPSLAQDMQDPTTSYGVHDAFQKIAAKGRFKGILNGIDTSGFDPTSTTILGHFAVNSDLSNVGQQKQLAKQALYEAGLISDPTKPLFLFIGRFSLEKGIERLPLMTEEIVARGGQVLIMGMTPYSMPACITQLVKMQETAPIKIFTRLKDQTKLIANTGVSQRMLASFASDFMLIPSKMESCGLVALEALCMGSFIAVSHIQGLKSICAPFDLEAPTSDQNCIKFDYHAEHESMVASIRDMIKHCFELEAQLTPASKAQIQKAIIKNSKQFDWDYTENGRGSMASYEQIFTKLIQELASNS